MHQWTDQEYRLDVLGRDRSLGALRRRRDDYDRTLDYGLSRYSPGLMDIYRQAIAYMNAEIARLIIQEATRAMSGGEPPG